MSPRWFPFIAAWVCTACASPLGAVNPAEWIIDETVDPHTTGGISWTSPTPIDLGYDVYDYAYDITTLEADAGLFGTIDLQQFIDAPLADEGVNAQLPIVLLDEMLMETIDLIVTEVTVAADVFIEIDEQGFAQLRATNIDVPSLVDSVTVRGTVSIEGYMAGDYDRDGVISAGDYSQWRSAYGSTTDLAPDGTLDGVVNALDYVAWRDRLGQPGQPSAAAVPEPAAVALLAAALLLAAARRAARVAFSGGIR